MLEKRGFLTIATGREEYYILAKNLLLSYRHFAKNPLPFAILCDKENEITAMFDKVIILDNPTFSWNDKLSIYKANVFEETIFIDADVLVYEDINGLFDVFSGESRISCFGEVYEKESEKGWFKCSEVGKFGELANCSINIHSGIVYVKNLQDEFLPKFYNLCLKIYDEYNDLKFKDFFIPADEPIVSLAMAILNCKPVSIKVNDYLLFLPIAKIKKLDIYHGKLTGTQTDNLQNDNTKWKMLHFEHHRTQSDYYIDEVKILYALIDGNKKLAKKISRQVWFKRKKYRFAVLVNKIFKRKKK